MKFLKTALLIFGLAAFSTVYSIYVNFFPNIIGKSIPSDINGIEEFYKRLYFLRFLANLPLISIVGGVIFLIIKARFKVKNALLIGLVAVFMLSAFIANTYYNRYNSYINNWQKLLSFTKYKDSQQKISGSFGCVFDSPGSRKIEQTTSDPPQAVKQYYLSNPPQSYSTEILEPFKDSSNTARIRVYQLLGIDEQGTRSFGGEYIVNITPTPSGSRIVIESNECGRY